MDRKRARSSKKWKAALAGATGLGAIATGWFFWGPPEDPREQAKGAEASGESPGSVRPDYALRGYVLGDRHRYDLELDTDVAGPQGTLIQYHLTGTWVVEVVDELKDGLRLMAHVDEPALSSPMAKGNVNLMQRLQASAKDFSVPLLIDLDREGRVEHMHVDPKSELQVRSMQRSIATAMQLVWPSPDAAKWNTTESDAVGVYEATYRKTTARRVQREKLRYQQLSKRANSLFGNSGTQVQLRKSLATFQVSDTGVVEQLEMEEVSEVEGTVLGGVVSTTSYRLSHRGSDDGGDVVLAAKLAKRTTTIRPFEHAVHNGFSSEADRSRLGDRTWDDLLAELRTLPVDRSQDTDADRTRRRKNFIAIGALLRLDETAADAVLEAIRNDDERARVLWDALASAGTPAAQSALREVIAMPQWSKGERRSQLIGLSMVKEPTTETVDLLRSMTDDPEQGKQARYGLGTAAHNLASAEPSRAEAIVNELAAQLDEQPGPASKSDYIRSLGNTGHPSAMQALAPHLGDDNDTVRGSAVWALRMQTGPEVDRKIAEAAVHDPSKAVRKSALRAARTRTASDTLIDAVARVYTRTGENDERQLAQSALLRFERERPGLLAQVSGGSGAP